MLKLFKIQPGKKAEAIFFSCKRQAKKKRDDLVEGGKIGVVVMRGPDHYRGESFNVSTQTRPTMGSRRRQRQHHGRI